MRVAVRSALLGALGAAAACYAYRSVPVAPAPGSRVRIVLISATTVATFGPGLEDRRRSYPGVLEAGGTLQAAAGDSVAVRLGELRTATGAVADVSGQVALVPTARIARIEQRRFQAGTTLLVGAGASLLALTVYVVILTVVLVRAI